MSTKVPESPVSPRRLHALVLGAGRGSRFGGGKLLAPYRSGLVIEGALAAAFAAPVEAVTLTVGCDGAAVAAAARVFAARVGETGRLRIVEVPDWADGMSASLRRGVAALPDEAEGVFVFLGDMPRVSAKVTAALAEALRGDVVATVPSFGGRQGHPALLGKALFGEIGGLTGDRGARGLLDAHAARVVEVDSPDDGVLFDIDAPADLTRAP